MHAELGLDWLDVLYSLVTLFRATCLITDADGDGLGRDSPHSPTGPNGPIATGLGRRGRRQDYSNFIKATAAEETGLAKASAEFDNFCAAGSLSCGGLNSLKYGPKGDLGSDAA